MLTRVTEFTTGTSVARWTGRRIKNKRDEERSKAASRPSSARFEERRLLKSHTFIIHFIIYSDLIDTHGGSEAHRHADNEDTRINANALRAVDFQGCLCVLFKPCSSALWVLATCAVRGWKCKRYLLQCSVYFYLYVLTHMFLITWTLSVYKNIYTLEYSGS